MVRLLMVFILFVLIYTWMVTTHSEQLVLSIGRKLYDSFFQKVSEAKMEIDWPKLPKPRRHEGEW